MRADSDISAALFCVWMEAERMVGVADATGAVSLAELVIIRVDRFGTTNGLEQKSFILH